VNAFISDAARPLDVLFNQMLSSVAQRVRWMYGSTYMMLNAIVCFKKKTIYFVSLHTPSYVIGLVLVIVLVTVLILVLVIVLVLVLGMGRASGYIKSGRAELCQEVMPRAREIIKCIQEYCFVILFSAFSSPAFQPSARSADSRPPFSSQPVSRPAVSSQPAQPFSRQPGAFELFFNGF
jgi:hypothetical protein